MTNVTSLRFEATFENTVEKSQTNTSNVTSLLICCWASPLPLQLHRETIWGDIWKLTHWTHCIFESSNTAHTPHLKTHTLHIWKLKLGKSLLICCCLASSPSPTSKWSYSASFRNLFFSTAFLFRTTPKSAKICGALKKLGCPLQFTNQVGKVTVVLPVFLKVCSRCVRRA